MAAGISIYSKTSSSVTLRLTGLDTSWTNGTRDVYWYLGSANGGIPTENAYYKTKSTTLADGVSSGGDVTFSGLQASTQYGIYCEIYHGSEFLKGLQGYVTTSSESGGGTVSIAKWSWTASNGSASADETNASYLAVRNKTEITNFSYLVWNDMVDKVNETLTAFNDEWYTTYGSLANTKMTATDRTLTAKRFNALRYNIENCYYAGDDTEVDTGIGKVKPGEDVLGSYFTKMMSTLNSCISDL